MEKTKRERELTNTLLAILTSITVIAALKASVSVTMPLAFALFLIILSWPLFKWLDARLPQKAAYALTILALLAIFSAFVGALFYSGKVIADAAPRYAEEAQQMWQKARDRAQAHDVELPQNPRELVLSSGSQNSSQQSESGAGSSSSGSSGQSSSSSQSNSGQSSSSQSGSGQSSSGGQSGGSHAARGASLLKPLLSMTGLWLLVIGLLILGLHEAPKFREKLKALGNNNDDGSEKNGGKLAEAIEQVIEKCGRYFLTRTVVSVIQGVCSGGAALVIGLDLAFIWGLTAALLNYIPTVGSVISVVPPTLFALFQFQDVGRAALVFFVMCAIQIGLGTFVDPLIEGRQLQISSFVVLFSIAFWGWVWGVPGALIGVPLTITILIFCSQFPGTKWLSDLFTDNDSKQTE